MKEKWILEAKKAKFDEIGKQFGISSVLARLIVNRGYKTTEEIDRYLNGSLSYLHDGRKMKNMIKAVDLITKAIQNQEAIAIGTDFDNDGIISGYTLQLAISRLGGTSYLYAPDRVKEGYGLNRRIVDDAVKEGCKMVITCDNGIAAFDAVDYAKSLGLIVIVTDHHEVAFEEEVDKSRTFLLPNADAVVNPKQHDCSYPFKGLCGAGVVFKLIQILYEDAKVPTQEINDLLQYTAIATVADVMDLVDENRIIVKYGLSMLSTTNNLGLRALMEACSINKDRLSAYHIGFVIGPCFNAAGRLDTAELAFDLLRAKNETIAKQLAKELRDLNEQRKEMTVKGVEQALKLIEESTIKNDKIIVVKLMNTHESLAGIIAGRVREAYHKPALVFVEVEDGLKGSGRSIESYDMFEELLKCKPLLSRFGGHKMAAGLSLPEENLSLLREQLNHNTTLTEEDFCPIIKIDVPLPIGYLSFDFIEELERLEPFGKGNAKPVFAQQHFQIRKAMILGKNQNVLKLNVVNDQGNSVDALYFGDIDAFNELVRTEFSEEELRKLYQGQYNNVDLAFTYYPSINEYMGRKSVQIVIQNYCRIKK